MRPRGLHAVDRIFVWPVLKARGQLLNFVELMGWAKLREVCW